MKSRMNRPHLSKINITSLITMVVTILCMWEIIPPEYSDRALRTVSLISPFLIIIFRTWFTEPATKSTTPYTFDPTKDTYNDTDGIDDHI